MDFEDQEEHDEEMEMEPSYDSLVHNNSNNNNNNNSNSGGGGGGGVGGGRVKMASAGGGEGAVAVASQQPTRKASRYRECLKNHAVGIGGHALDGCGEFLAAGADGTLDALKCAACSCHRNFHRKETDEPYGQLVPHQGHVSGHHHHGFGHPQFSPTATGYYRTPGGYLHVTTQHRPLALPSTSGGGGTDQDDDMSNPSGGGGGGFGMGTTSSKKRFRTKFSQEQKERMLELAERLSWRIQKQDEAAVQSFCDETGVKRHVLKVWMHNNKHTLGKKP